MTHVLIHTLAHVTLVLCLSEGSKKEVHAQWQRRFVVKGSSLENKVDGKIGLWATFACAVVGLSLSHKGKVLTYKAMKWNWMLKAIKYIHCSHRP